MYKPLGLCLNDFDLSYNPHDKQFELIHLQGPPLPTDMYDGTLLETSYGYATSHDLMNWKGGANVFGIAEEQDTFDNSAIWTMHTLYTENNTKRFMFYTGLNRRDYFFQQVGLAEYDFNQKCWNRYQEGPIVKPDPAYYQTSGEMAWRDPFVIHDPDKDHYVMFVCARDGRLRSRKNGCVGMAISKDLYNWKVQPPLISPGKYYEMECPTYYHKNGHHYFLISTGDTRQVHIWRSNDLYGEYEEIGTLTEPHDYAPRIVEYQGEDILLHTKWIKRIDPQDNKVWSRGYLDDPKRLIQHDDGMLSLEPFIP